MKPISQVPKYTIVLWEVRQLVITPPVLSLSATTEEELLIANTHFVPLLKNGCDLLAEILSILRKLLEALIHLIILKKKDAQRLWTLPKTELL